jgi:protein phosphatase
VEFNYFGKTDLGKVRELNEDALHCFIHKDVMFLIVADGLGSREGFDIPSVIAVNEIRRHIEKYLISDNAAHLKTLVSQSLFWTNRVLLAFKRANEPIYAGFGTTITMCAINKNKDIVIGHAGNSRLYILRNGTLVQMTKDHTEAQRLYEQKKITKEEIRTHPERGTLTKGLGVWEDPECDVFGGKLVKEDIVLLCTDGVFSMLTDEEIQAIIIESGNTETACDWFMEGANQRGGVDNISAVISYINF